MVAIRLPTACRLYPRAHMPLTCAGALPLKKALKGQFCRPLATDLPSTYILKGWGGSALPTRKPREVKRLPCRAAATNGATTPSPLSRFLANNFVPVALLIVTTIGWLFPGPGALAAAHNMQRYSTMGVFVLSGMLIQHGEAIQALKSPLAMIYSLVFILFVTPLLAIPVLHLPLQPPEMALGLAVFCCVPTTLSNCVILTNICRGNSAVALLLVVSTNILGVFTIPSVLGLVLGSSAAGASFDQAGLFRNLVSTVLIPLIAGVALQLSIPGLPDWRARNRKNLSYLSTFFLCMVPWMQLSVAATSNLPLTPAAVAAAAASGAGVHLVLLAATLALTSFMRFSKEAAQDDAIRKAVVLCTSEKTLPVSVAVLNQLAAVGGAAMGLAVIPCVFAHILQISIDSALVSYWNGREQRAIPAPAVA